MWIEFYICLGQTKALFALLMDLYYPKANFIWGSNYDMVGLDFISWGQKSLDREWGGDIASWTNLLSKMSTIYNYINFGIYGTIKSVNIFNIGILSSLVSSSLVINFLKLHSLVLIEKLLLKGLT